jgi:hypothetical protein
MDTTNIKKAYVELVAFLNDNADKKVKTILPDIIAMVEKASGGGSVGNTVRRDEHGNVVAIFCYYHKEWEEVAVVPYGKKANSTSGLNTMCKQGTSAWTKQQREAKQAKSDLLEKVASGDVQASELTVELEKIEEARKAIKPYSFDEPEVESDEAE